MTGRRGGDDGRDFGVTDGDRDVVEGMVAGECADAAGWDDGGVGRGVEVGADDVAAAVSSR